MRPAAVSAAAAGTLAAAVVATPALQNHAVETGALVDAVALLNASSDEAVLERGMALVDVLIADNTAAQAAFFSAGGLEATLSVLGRAATDVSTAEILAVVQTLMRVRPDVQATAKQLHFDVPGLLNHVSRTPGRSPEVVATVARVARAWVGSDGGGGSTSRSILPAISA